jgi:hypothetical protein
MADDDLCLPEGVNGAIIFDFEPTKDRSGLECGICGHPFGHAYPSGCPACGNAILNPPPPIFPHPNWVP